MYGHKKAPKSQQQDKQIINLHLKYNDLPKKASLDEFLVSSLEYWSKISPNKSIYKIKDQEYPGPESIIITSIDPATINLGFRIEERFSDGSVKTIIYCRILF